MTRKRTLLPMLLVVLLLGLAAGFAGTNAGHADGGTTGDSPAVTTDSGTTDPVTTTDPAPTTTDPAPTTSDPAPTTSDPAPTTTDPAPTTTDPAPTTTDPAPTTTAGDTTSGASSDTSTQGAAQATQGSPPPTTDATTTTPPPTAPCDTTQLTCGNNAATQIAVVSQNCVAASSNPVISVSVTTIGGAPVNHFTIGDVTSCLNVVNITQVVQQFCIGCTIIVVPPPPPPPPLLAAIQPQAHDDSPTRSGYCMPQPVLRGDGTWGRFVNLTAGQPQHDPQYKDAVPATFTPGVGYSCADGSIVAGANVPTFTLTVPASFVGQFVNLCIQPAVATQKPVCHAIKIDNGATVTIPVASNVAATVTTPPISPADKPKSKAQIAAAADAYGQTLTKSTAGTTHTHRKGKH